MWYVFGGIIVAILAFQFFLRYDYVHLRGGYVMRLDRLSASSCIMPCLPTSSPKPYDQKQAIAEFISVIENQNQQAIDLAKATPKARAIVANGASYSWTAEIGDKGGRDYSCKLMPTTNIFTRALCPSPSPAERVRDPNTSNFQIKIVCYCDSKGQGWRWEVHTDTNEVFYVNDNADLMTKYGFARRH
jgi:hypothetical protein